jgi:hypothetical protein
VLADWQERHASGAALALARDTLIGIDPHVNLISVDANLGRAQTCDPEFRSRIDARLFKRSSQHR